MPRAANAHKRNGPDTDLDDEAPDYGVGAQQRVIRTAATGTPPATHAASSVFALAKAAKPPRAKGAGGNMQRLPVLDVSKLTFDEGVPVPPRTHKRGSSRYEAVFAGLAKPGMSVALPARYAGSIGSAAKKRATLGLGKYAVRHIDAETVRLFRME